MEGRKFDDGKPRIAEMMIDFAPAMREIAKVWAFGADKYDKSNWKDVENGIDRYTNAMLRHLLQEQEYPFDRESNLLHATHVAWNAIARLCLILKDSFLPQISVQNKN